jgi:hypothetical protein
MLQGVCCEDLSEAAGCAFASAMGCVHRARRQLEAWLPGADLAPDPRGFGAAV